MKIVVLDGYTLNPGDLSWDGLRELGDCEIYDRTPPEQVIERAQDADAILINKVEIDGDIMDQLPNLKYIGVLATGYDVVDGEAARERGIPVTNVPTYGTPSVAQMAFAHLLNLTQHVAHHSRTVKEEKRWSKGEEWCYWDYPLIELQGLTMGIIGLGRIGRAVADLAHAFGMQVVAHDPYVEDATVPEITMVDLDTLFTQSDVVTIHCPLTPETEGLVDAERLAMMKETAFILNNGRGPVIDNEALAEALNNGIIAGAGLDVLENEPPALDNPLLEAKNCYITPHISWATRASRSRLMNTAVENVKAWMQDNPQNVVN
ncbi:MAG: D-2-hydroxyacid dehydrogenase [Anaerolineales bacterium]